MENFGATDPDVAILVLASLQHPCKLQAYSLIAVRAR